MRRPGNIPCMPVLDTDFKWVDMVARKKGTFKGVFFVRREKF